LNQSPLPARFKLGFALGALSLAVVAVLWIASLRRGAPTVEEAVESVEDVLTSTGAFKNPLSIVLQGVALPQRQIYEVGETLKKVLDPRTLKGSDQYRIVRSSTGVFREIVITRALTEYVVQASSSALRSMIRDIPVTAEERSRGGTLNVSLWETMQSNQLTADLIVEFADIFAWTIDFLTEPRAGDRYALVWEHRAAPGGIVVDRRITAALYEGERTGREAAFYFNGHYYDQKGNSVRRAFLSAPLNYRRISSGFSRRRFHPILRYFRPHLGIDYAAATGTPVVSIGNGTVVYKGWKGAFGNYVEVRHNPMYTTCYGHFSRYAKGLRVGQKVSQGQVVGYVGSTGHSTGPHLDFRIRENGKYINFLNLVKSKRLPAEKSVPASQRAAFEELRKKRMEQLEGLLKGASGPDAAPTS